ncbi:MAG: hypothetical protein QOH04_3094 [Sphingomonadales bacterium]|nr:hypothetical protein [Sphingomonadales bacterium]
MHRLTQRFVELGSAEGKRDMNFVGKVQFSDGDGIIHSPLRRIPVVTIVSAYQQEGVLPLLYPKRPGARGPYSANLRRATPDLPGLNVRWPVNAVTDGPSARRRTLQPLPDRRYPNAPGLAFGKSEAAIAVHGRGETPLPKRFTPIIPSPRRARWAGRGAGKVGLTIDRQ